MSQNATSNSRGVFVTGTNTNIGKTLCCAVLMALLDAVYWKPIQTGPEEDHDAPFVQDLSGCLDAEIMPSNYSFPDPLSPHEAARRAGGHIDLSKINWPKNAHKFTIIEGAGGVLVPLNEDKLVIDLMSQINMPSLIVASSELGTINHTLLTLEALRTRHIDIHGVILSGPENEGNKKAIETYGDIDVVGHLPLLNEVNAESFKTLLPHLDQIAQKLGPLRKTNS